MAELPDTQRPAIQTSELVRFSKAAGVALHASPPPLVTGNRAGRNGHLGPSDFDLNPDSRSALLEAPPPRRAAVLVPIVAGAEPSVLLTVRTGHLSRHAGQIAFPGGRQDDTDASLAATALRETREETGIEAHFVTPLGYLDWYRTGTGYAICPLVGIVAPGFTIRPDPNEVADVFMVPLAFLMDSANHQRHSRILEGRERHFYAMPYGDRFIWGATAGIIRNMSERFSAA
ncbi:MAG: CoA pyrophosphatase [Hyphomicrobiaceae bacterium]|nr:CoA pyrophosphatase [Hyphomicrobiaceae bacterium]